MDLVKSIGEKRDIPMILESVTFDDNYDSGFDEKRVITHTLSFTAKLTYLAQLQILVLVLSRKFKLITQLILIQELQQDLRDMLLHREHSKIITMTELQDLQKI